MPMLLVSDAVDPHLIFYIISPTVADVPNGYGRSRSNALSPGPDVDSRWIQDDFMPYSCNLLHERNENLR